MVRLIDRGRDHRRTRQGRGHGGKQATGRTGVFAKQTNTVVAGLAEATAAAGGRVWAGSSAGWSLSPLPQGLGNLCLASCWLVGGMGRWARGVVCVLGVRDEADDPQDQGTNWRRQSQRGSEDSRVRRQGQDLPSRRSLQRRQPARVPVCLSLMRCQVLCPPTSQYGFKRRGEPACDAGRDSDPSRWIWRVDGADVGQAGR